ncbi:LacI family DNA-binding transcriptional regulator [Amycolatopsis jiangsuensis]|uniref:LacI family transcriptional regulator n=1 Tax=Amycolatopsis jiangsuensis TaxID=1181879 RepID=A0A840J1C0_9PSEU|nr:substrate-binding domain-containing protein [Amycolatopsis jiangsuensis]MBB4687445.1 LacI family transcriptional regulator [Amycolatopsis jiangsuensis]
MTVLAPVAPVWDPPVAYRFGVALGRHANPYNDRLLRAIRGAAARSGCDLLLADTGDSVREEAAVVRALRADRVDGMLLVPAPGDEAVVNGLVRMGVPTVLVDRIAGRNDVDQVGSENIQAMSALVEHLASRRHRRIALITGESGSTVSEERTLGYRLGLGRAGLRYNPELVACGMSSAGGAARAAAKLLDGWPSPTAIVVAGEAMLIGVQWEAHRRAVRIGSELAVVGYGDMDWARTVSPGVTTMAQPISEMGRRAVQLLVERCREPERRPEAVRLAPRFLHRASCGC